MTVPGEKPLWFDRLIRPMWLAVGAGALVVLAVSVWTPEVMPVVPESAALAPETNASVAPELGEAAVDFVERPLFLATRRPIASVELGPAEKAPAQIPDNTAQKISGVSLLGVFSSEGIQGVILSEQGGGNRRLFEGERLQGWVLANVEPRSAVFRNGNRVARVDMAVISDLPPPASVRKESEAGSQGKSAAVDEKPSYVPTFDNMYRDKARSLESQAQDTDKPLDSAEEGSKENGK